jgi:hypothetical protein
MLAGVVALALTGAGTAIAWSAADSPSPAPSPSASEKSGEPTPGRSGKADKGDAEQSHRAETKITKFPAPAADGSPAKGDDGKRLKPTAGTIADIAAGDAVRISAVKAGDQATAQRIVKGAGGGSGLGRGHGYGHGKGHKVSTGNI